MKLFKIENGIGIYWVVAEHPTQAEEKLKAILDANDYGFSDKRKVVTITVIAEFVENNYLTKKFLIL